MGLQDGTVLAFSVTTLGPTTAYGIVQSASVNETTERAEAKGASGNTVSIQEYDDRKELSLTYLELGTPATPPAIGTLFTYDGDSYAISSINRTETVDGFVSVDVTATCYPNLP